MCAFLIITALLVSESNAIIDGKNASIKDFPYHVAILADGRDRCQGVIIDKNWILTTGQYCVASQLAWMSDLHESKRFTVRAGTDLREGGGSIHQIDKIVKHPGYNDSKVSTVFNNIFLVRVKEPFNFDETRQPIELYKAGDKPLHCEIANLTGFGIIKGFRNPKTLQSIEISIANMARCKHLADGYDKIPDGFICAGYSYEVGGKNACYRDWGAPLVINGRLAGIVSNIDLLCAVEDRPVLCSDIGYYRNWIDQQINNC